MSDGKRFITDILVGSRRRERLGNLNGLAAAIAGEGLRHAVVITPGNRLISGYRRLKAVELLGVPDVPVLVADDLAAAVDFIVAENRDADPQAPMTASELVDYVETIRSLRRTTRLRTIRAAANAIFDFSYSRFCLIQQVVDAARDEDEDDGPFHQGLAHLDAILAGAQPRGADGRLVTLKSLVAAATGTEVVRPAPLARVVPVGRRTPARAQDKALASAMAGLNGLVAGLSQVDAIDPSISPADVGRWMADINRAQRTLRTLNTLMKEHSDATR